MEQKNPNVARVLLNSVLLFFVLFPSNIFAEASCDIISKGIFKNSKLTPELSFLNEFVEKLQNDDTKNLKPYFHSKLYVKKSIGLRIKKILDGKLIAPLNYNIFRVWKIQGDDKTPINCNKLDDFNIIPRYGYQNQYASMVSVLAKNDLARMFISFAKSKGKYKITGLHIQQWTHEGEDYKYWVNKSFQDKNLINKWIHLDIAIKLLVGGDFVEYPLKKEIVNQRELVISSNQILDQINRETKRNDIVYFGSLLGRRSTGAFIRVTIDKQTPGYKLKAICSSIGKSLLSTEWFNKLGGGIRCNFIFKGMNPREDSKIGGYYLTRRDLTNEKKDI